MFGPNWRSTYEEKLFLGTDGYPKYARSDGSFWSLGIGISGSSWVFAAPANVNGSMPQILLDPHVAPPPKTITFGNGEKRVFDPATGNLTMIIDRNGNTTQIAYDSSGRLSTVTDPASRQLIFVYGNSGNNLVTSVTSNFGISLTYTYDTQGRLTQVTEPDSSTLNFSYNSQSLISSVTDMNGKVLESHTYDSQLRGLTSVRALGVDAVTITYPNP
jgi:YD repeat-containing protein